MLKNYSHSSFKNKICNFHEIIWFNYIMLISTCIYKYLQILSLQNKIPYYVISVFTYSLDYTYIWPYTHKSECNLSPFSLTCSLLKQNHLRGFLNFSKLLLTAFYPCLTDFYAFSSIGCEFICTNKFAKFLCYRVSTNNNFSIYTGSFKSVNCCFHGVDSKC